jgi:hypothetical protein
MVVEGTCPTCKKVLFGFQWTKTTSGKNWLMSTEGKWHSCDKAQNKEGKKSKHHTLGEKSVHEPQYFSCGCCGDNLKEIFSDKMLYFFVAPRLETIGWWCESCNMFPSVTNRKHDEVSKGRKDSNVKALCTSNRDIIIEELRSGKITVTSDKIERVGDHVENGEKPTNWMCMNEDGTMMKGYKLTSNLTKWFEADGSAIIKKLNERTIYTKLEKPLE